MTLNDFVTNGSFKILNSGEIVWTSPDVLDWYRVPEGRVCVDRESQEDTGKGNTVLIGCLEDFVPTITEASPLTLNKEKLSKTPH